MSEDEFETGASDQFIERLEAEVQVLLDADERQSFASFIRLFFHRYSFDDLAGRRWQDLAGWVVYLWRFSRATDSLPRVEIIHPGATQQLWVCPHTILLVHQKDMPFLVDSVRIELTARNIPIYSIKSMPYSLSSNAAGDTLLHAVSDHSENPQALIYLEIGYDADAQSTDDLHDALADVLDQVSKVVSDYSQLKERTHILASSLAAAEDNNHFQNVAQTREFLQWLIDDHFIFLGYSEFDLGERKGKKALIEDKSQRLGLFDNQSATRIKTLGETGGGGPFLSVADGGGFFQIPAALTRSSPRLSRLCGGQTF